MVNYRMRIEVLIDGMVSVHAKHAVFAALAGVPGVARAEVELGRVVLEVEAGAGSSAIGAGGALDVSIRGAVEAAGFGVREVRALGRRLPLL